MTGLPDDAPSEPGTVIAMLGRGEVPKLIAWCSDGLYSHVGVVVDGGDFVEARTTGVTLTPMADRWDEIKARVRRATWRPRNDDGSPLDAAQARALSDAARVHVGRPYDTGVLVQLGMVVLVKRRVPTGAEKWPARALILAALDSLVAGDRERVTCSELVYRVFQEAAANPGLVPRLVEAARLNLPFPDVDWVAFAEEAIGIYFPEERAKGEPEGPTAPSLDKPSVEDVTRRIEEVAVRLGLATGMPTSPGLPLPAPNPKVVQIPELTSSPRFEPVLVHPPAP